MFTSGRLDVYILVPMLWALYNAIPPLLFFVYFFTKGRVLQGMCSVMQVLGVILAAGEAGDRVVRAVWDWAWLRVFAGVLWGRWVAEGVVGTRPRGCTGVLLATCSTLPPCALLALPGFVQP